MPWNVIFGMLAAVAGSFALGSLWYHPRVFGAMWMRHTRVAPEIFVGGVYRRWRAVVFESLMLGCIAAVTFWMYAHFARGITSALSLAAAFGVMLLIPLVRHAVLTGRSSVPLFIDIGYYAAQLLLVSVLAWLFV